VVGKWDGLIVYVRERMASYNRKRLVEHKVPFVVPGNQMYLPMLGIDLREHFRMLNESKEVLRPATQVVLIQSLLLGAGDLGPTALSLELGYSIMAMSRALDELKAVELVHTTIRGRERHVRLAGSRREVWEKAQPYLRNPVVKRYGVNLLPGAKLPGPRAGLGALAHYSMLNELENVEVALARGDWKRVLETGNIEPTGVINEPGTTIVEIWSYSPILFSDGDFVDRLSLYLSLRDTQDERVQAALNQMIKEELW
ncbi:MAG: hypothetical protein GX811_03590, partial [Lentisphaerae bacterium]|nr:hypothetical protein [Lentisphaerota bacterium]